VAGTALSGRPLTDAPIPWRVATVRDITMASAHARTIVLEVPGWPGHLAGQHVDVRLVAEDGYQAQRSYSIASAPEDPMLALTIERLDEGEVSPYLADVLRPGDGLELRGPIGGYFVWDVGDGGPLLLVAGGSGVVPLLAMLRHRAHADAAARARVPARLLYSARSWSDVIDRQEIERLALTTGAEVTFTLTRETPSGWTGLRRRVDREMLDAVAWPANTAPIAYVCGPTPFVESVATLLVEIGYDPLRVRTERFGPTG
jgi:ferredoxin-NADP reductase